MYIGSGAFRVVGNPVPDGSRLICSQINPSGDINLLIEHETFEDVFPPYPLLDPPIIMREAAQSISADVCSDGSRREA